MNPEIPNRTVSSPQAKKVMEFLRKQAAIENPMITTQDGPTGNVLLQDDPEAGSHDGDDESAVVPKVSPKIIEELRTWEANFDEDVERERLDASSDDEEPPPFRPRILSFSGAASDSEGDFPSFLSLSSTEQPALAVGTWETQILRNNKKKQPPRTTERGWANLNPGILGCVLDYLNFCDVHFCALVSPTWAKVP